MVDYIGNLDRVTRISIKARTSDGASVDVGLIQSINVSEKREIASHYTLGTGSEEPTALIPGIVTGRTISMKALAFYKKSILGKFASSTDQFMYSLKQQKLPFDIVVTKKRAGSDTESYSITYGGCFFTDFSYDQDISRGGDVVLVENGTAVYQTISAA